ncbi:hypothetical protein PsorP6_014639 [Peronosclerospora sorghi]|uniref:Uncharacterized protein n=1 Tax=Peronosclerospora sorghi TaxID=230839 RepID=A0ACC0VTR9_9STRA|nr:hypothetical protein PsorP6_014639 [Peronosclerospora sorghi]
MERIPCEQFLIEDHSPTKSRVLPDFTPHSADARIRLLSLSSSGVVVEERDATIILHTTNLHFLADLNTRLITKPGVHEQNAGSEPEWMKSASTCGGATRAKLVAHCFVLVLEV